MWIKFNKVLDILVICILAYLLPVATRTLFRYTTGTVEKLKLYVLTLRIKPIFRVKKFSIK